jgi:hypothetical protein
MKRLPAVVLGLVLLLILGRVSAQSPQTAPAANGKTAARARFVGTWKLLYRDTPGKVGAEAVRTVESGRLTYDEHGNMTVQVAREGQDKLTRSSEPQQLLSMYTAYFGTYVVDEANGTMTHQIEGSLSPNMIGRPSPHFYKFSSDGQRLALTSPGSTSTWERLR